MSPNYDTDIKDFFPFIVGDSNEYYQIARFWIDINLEEVKWTEVVAVITSFDTIEFRVYDGCNRIGAFPVTPKYGDMKEFIDERVYFRLTQRADDELKQRERIARIKVVKSIASRMQADIKANMDIANNEGGER